MVTFPAKYILKLTQHRNLKINYIMWLVKTKKYPVLRKIFEYVFLIPS